MNINRNYYMGKSTENIPNQIKDGSIYYAEKENELYIDAFGNRNIIGQQYWNYSNDFWDEVINNKAFVNNLNIGDQYDIAVSDQDLQKITMVLVAINADDKADGSGKARTSWICKDCYIESPMWATNWDGSYVQYLLMNNYYGTIILFPDIIRKNIVPVKKTFVSSDNTTHESIDSIWIPSYREIFGGSEYESYGVDYTQYFMNNNHAIKKNIATNSPYSWWLRTTPNNSSIENGMMVINENGTIEVINYGSTKGVIFGFCL